MSRTCLSTPVSHPSPFGTPAPHTSFPRAPWHQGPERFSLRFLDVGALYTYAAQSPQPPVSRLVNLPWERQLGALGAGDGAPHGWWLPCWTRTRAWSPCGPRCPEPCPGEIPPAVPTQSLQIRTVTQPGPVATLRLPVPPRPSPGGPPPRPERPGPPLPGEAVGTTE